MKITLFYNAQVEETWAAVGALGVKFGADMVVTAVSSTVLQDHPVVVRPLSPPFPTPQEAQRCAVPGPWAAAGGGAGR
eukprot:SAG11_NODE_16972_length_532_cov_1.154734_2_plen_78_part_00